MFEHVTPYAGDPILSLMERFIADERPDKVNLSIGIYYDQQGRVPVLNSIKKSKNLLDTHVDEPCLYLPMEGMEAYREAVRELIFGSDHPVLSESRSATIQTLGGSGALMIGASFLHHYFPDSNVWVSDPTWQNHQAIFSGAGLEVRNYPYFDPATKTLDFGNMLNSIKGLDEKSVLLLHPCCHNPTGVDLSHEQWDQVIEVIKKNRLIPFFDIAYQGYGDGIDEDVYVIRRLTQESGLIAFVSSSFSKIFSLYGERAGSLSVVCRNSEETERVLGQLKATVRCNYSTPPKNGAALISNVLNRHELKQLWINEVNDMRARILLMREKLYLRLNELCPGKDFRFLIQQKGMFSYTGITPEQVDGLRKKFGVYLLASGRICLAGLNEGNIEKVAQAFALL